MCLCRQFPGNVDASSEAARRGTSAARKSHELCQAQDQSAACYVRTHKYMVKIPAQMCCFIQCLFFFMFVAVAALG